MERKITVFLFILAIFCSSCEKQLTKECVDISEIDPKAFELYCK
jgi:hypothetical protein